MHDGPVRVDAFCVFLRPKSGPGRKRPHHTVKPDIDNIAKAILDCCTGLLWKDDVQVVALNVEKAYGDRERIELAVSEYGEVG